MEILDVSDQQRICDFYQSILTGLIEVGVSVGVSVGMSEGVSASDSASCRLSCARPCTPLRMCGGT